MGRPKLYHTEQERKDARRRYNKTAYAKSKRVKAGRENGSSEAEPKEQKGEPLVEKRACKQTLLSFLPATPSGLSEAKAKQDLPHLSTKLLDVRTGTTDAAPAHFVKGSGVIGGSQHVRSISARQRPLDPAISIDSEEPEWPSDDTDASTTEKDPLPIQDQCDLLEFEVDLWVPGRMYARRSLGAFMWGVFRNTPQNFPDQMAAMIDSGQRITRRLFAFLASSREDDVSPYIEKIEWLNFRVHLAMAAIQIRRQMIEDGFVQAFPAIMEWDAVPGDWNGVAPRQK
ncbi:hypothetical protein HWV62_30459 [Athelia sp. TMB]|nr:hypothetical protein HWV62_30459 [Athelia sp. TMB]